MIDFIHQVWPHIKGVSVTFLLLFFIALAVVIKENLGDKR